MRESIYYIELAERIINYAYQNRPYYITAHVKREGQHMMFLALRHNSRNNYTCNLAFGESSTRAEILGRVYGFLGTCYDAGYTVRLKGYPWPHKYYRPIKDNSNHWQEVIL